MNVAVLPTVSLFAGVGGLERGLEAALDPAGVEVRGCLYVEAEAFAMGALVEAMFRGTVAPAPVWSMVEDCPAFLYAPLRRLAERQLLAFTMGPPCQPHSAAGQRQHTDDDRWIWPSVATWIFRVRPGLVLLENVPGLALGGLDVIVSDLAALGYSAEWDCFTASEAGAPHKRERLFLVAVLPDARGQLEGWLQPGGRERERPGETEFRDVGEDVASIRQRRELVDADNQRPPGDEAGEPGAPGADPLGRRAGLPRGGALPPFPPGPRDWRGWLAVLRAGRWDLFPALTAEEEWRLADAGRRVGAHPDGPSGNGGPPPERPVRGVDDGLAGACRPSVLFDQRIDGLRALGNGVVPQQAALAFRTLIRRLISS